jgi:hypothetical protein
MASRYPTTKLLEVFIVRKMAARRRAEPYPITINTTNPGLCNSGLGGGEEGLLFKVISFLLRVWLRSALGTWVTMLAWALSLTANASTGVGYKSLPPLLRTLWA